MYPEVLALATQNATEDDIAHIQTTAHKYLTLHAETTRRGVPLADAPEQTSLRDSWENLLQAIFDATHNQVMALLARPLIQLHGARDWVGLEEDLTTQETQFVKTLLALIAAGDPAAAREQTRSLMKLPSEAVDALSKTAVATPTMIVLD
jgi:DNA-binding FadR family transcriptional regulator